jgi:hypothetical protein
MRKATVMRAKGWRWEELVVVAKACSCWRGAGGWSIQDPLLLCPNQSLLLRLRKEGQVSWAVALSNAYPPGAHSFEQRRSVRSGCTANTSGRGSPWSYDSRLKCQVCRLQIWTRFFDSVRSWGQWNRGSSHRRLTLRSWTCGGIKPTSLSRWYQFWRFRISWRIWVWGNRIGFSVRPEERQVHPRFMFRSLLVVLLSLAP